jgi:hypothetical protein
VISLILFGRDAWKRNAKAASSRVVWAGVRVIARDGSSWVNGDLPAACAWIERHTGPGDAVASTNPWAINLYTRRPSIILPGGLTKDSFRAFVAEYRVRCVLLSRRYPYRPSFTEPLNYLDFLDPSERTKVQEIGSYLILDFR